MRVRVRVHPDLRLFLPSRARTARELELVDDGTGTVGHVVQAAGVPLTEVGAVTTAGHHLGLDDRATEELDVQPRERPQPLGGPPRLLLDVHLGTLVRRLRLLGVDAAFAADVDDAVLVTRANDEDRLLLTQDRRLLMRRALRRGAFVRGSSAEAQLDDVLGRFRLPLSPYTRCTACGGELHEVSKTDVLDRLEPGTRRTQEQFRQCARCGQVFWRGAHARRLDQLVSRWG